MATKRKNNWPAALDLFLREKDGQAFNWQHNNCAFFACDWVAILVGVDPAADFRGEVQSALSARRVLERVGGIECVAAAASARWGWPEVPVKRAQRGDVVTHPGEDGPALGVCVGQLSAFAVGPGVKYFNTTDCLRAWRIG